MWPGNMIPNAGDVIPSESYYHPPPVPTPQPLVPGPMMPGCPPPIHSNQQHLQHHHHHHQQLNNTPQQVGF